MNNVYLAEALKIVKSPNILVNMVSQRVRQLGQGHKPLVATLPSVSYMDVALQEIADGKLQFEIEELSTESEKGKSRKKK